MNILVGRSGSETCGLTPILLPHHGASGAVLSFGMRPEELPVARPIDLHRFRAVFPDKWASLMQKHFQSGEHVAFFFGVSERTARGWLEGTSKPTGPSAILAAARIPGAVQFLLGEAA